MNSKQKLGYTLLGAGVMAVGIIIGQIITPDIKAQSNGVFDEIACRELSVVTESGKVGIRLGSSDSGGNVISINNKFGRSAMLFFVEDYGNRIIIYDNEETESLRFSARTGHNALAVRGKLGRGDTGIRLTTSEVMNRVEVYDTAGKNAVVLQGAEDTNGVYVLDKSDRRAISLTHTPPPFESNRIKIRDKEGNVEWIAP